jgi:SH3-like domain-containing protein
MRRQETTLMLAFLILSSLPAGAATMRSISRDNVNVRRGPSASHDVYFQAPRGYPIEVKRSEGEWVLFRDWEGDEGWVNRALVGTSKTVVVARETVNLRRGPGTDTPILEKTTRGKIYKVLASKDQWLRLGYYDTNEFAGWVRRDLVWGQ